ncbi:hypothetical protein FGO68_gene10132 [Halteria grandinella]|uniref:Uncharacterized protein n=1 Tax=Halteria grandinella TaxID=5974 RepID=A0A8J8NX30_HALGN|nr:hypothetical protein FGO68_gene10132 [Halteria grandinella]
MKRKQLNQLWEIYTGQYSGVEYRNLEMIFQGALSKCSRKKISTLGLDFMSATVFKDRVTEELQLTGKSVIKMVGISVENCQNLIKLNIDLGMQLKDIFQVKQSKLQEIEIHNCSNDYNFVQELIQKSKRTLLSLTLNQCHNFDLSPIKYSRLINHLSIIKCKNLRKEDSIATLKTLVYLESDQEQILFFSKRIDKLRRITLNLSKVNQKSIQQRQIDTVRSILYQGCVNYEWLNLILQRNPLITDAILPVFDNASQIVKLLGSYQQIQFSFRLFKSEQYLEALTLKQAIQFMKSKQNQNSIITNPDHKVYELLSKRLIDKQQLYHPYMAALTKSNYEIQENLMFICEKPPTILKQLEHFNEFDKYLSRMDNHHFHYTYQPAKYFEEVFKNQLLNSKEEQYIRSIVQSYDEAYNLGGDLEQVVKKIQSMNCTQLNEISTNRERYFELCRKNSRSKT